MELRMKAKKYITGLLLFLVLIIVFFPLGNNVYAEALKLNITSDKEEIKNGDEIRIKVTWNKEMQAADFYLNYDSNKLEYLKSDIDDVFINDNAKEGKIKTAWVSMDDSKRTSIEYNFKIKNSGQLKFTTNVNGGFATENIEVPDGYNEGELIIGKQEKNYIVYIVIVAIVIILAFIVIKNNKKGKNKNLNRGNLK